MLRVNLYHWSQSPYLRRSPFRNLELWTWLQIDFQQCLMCGVKSFLALVKPSSLLLRRFSNPCLRDEGSGGPRETNTGAGEEGGWARDMADGGWPLLAFLGRQRQNF